MMNWLEEQSLCAGGANSPERVRRGIEVKYLTLTFDLRKLGTFALLAYFVSDKGVITLLAQDSSNKPISVLYASEIGVSLQLADISAPCLQYLSFIEKDVSGLVRLFLAGKYIGDML